MRFRDRAEARRRLAERLLRLKDADPVVLALPRGGVPIAVPVAEALGAPLDLLLVRKIGAPGQPELALGAVVEGTPPRPVLNEDVVAAFGLSAAQVAERQAQAEAELADRRALLLGPGRPPPRLAGRAVVVVDDGVATGATAEAALRAARAAGAARVLLAVPVIAAEVAGRFRAAGVEVVALAEPRRLSAVGAWYADFRQLEDAEVLALLARAPAPPGMT
jgi:putative phosphoribosyl transferase